MFFCFFGSLDPPRSSKQLHAQTTGSVLRTSVCIQCLKAPTIEWICIWLGKQTCIFWPAVWYLVMNAGHSEPSYWLIIMLMVCTIFVLYDCKLAVQVSVVHASYYNLYSPVKTQAVYQFNWFVNIKEGDTYTLNQAEWLEEKVNLICVCFLWSD